MDDVILTFGSVTYANKAKRLLLKNGIEASLTKTNDKSTGCVHGVKLSGQYYYSAVKLLRDADITFSVAKKTI